ncbi:MAG: hypothetical protein ACTTKL_01610 [Treponema sp.]
MAVNKTTYSALNFEFANLFRQLFNTVFIFPRQVIHFLHLMIDLSAPRRYLLQTAFTERESYY